MNERAVGGDIECCEGAAGAACGTSIADATGAVIAGSAIGDSACVAWVDSMGEVAERVGSALIFSTFIVSAFAGPGRTIAFDAGLGMDTGTVGAAGSVASGLACTSLMTAFGGTLTAAEAFGCAAIFPDVSLGLAVCFEARCAFVGAAAFAGAAFSGDTFDGAAFAADVDRADFISFCLGAALTATLAVGFDGTLLARGAVAAPPADCDGFGAARPALPPLPANPRPAPAFVTCLPEDGGAGTFRAVVADAGEAFMPNLMLP